MQENDDAAGEECLLFVQHGADKVHHLFPGMCLYAIAGMASPFQVPAIDGITPRSQGVSGFFSIGTLVPGKTVQPEKVAARQTGEPVGLPKTIAASVKIGQYLQRLFEPGFIMPFGMGIAVITDLYHRVVLVFLEKQTVFMGSADIVADEKNIDRQTILL